MLGAAQRGLKVQKGQGTNTRPARRRAARGREGRRGRDVALVEAMEGRVLLAATDPVISEFMADNRMTLKDRFGDYSDWIEVMNPTAAAVNLDGWYLTDTASKLTEWRFPAVTLAPGGYLTVFASGRDLRTPGQELHTNFKLDPDGEYLAVVRPDGSVAFDYGPKYPRQVPDVSYGVTTQLTSSTLLTAGASAGVLVPSSDIGPNWTQVGFSDTSWPIHGMTGIGFDATTQQGALPAKPGANFYWGQFGANGTYNLYEVVSTAANWADANKAAKAKSQNGVSGHLVTIRSSAENAFVRSILDYDSWIGLTDDTVYGGKEYGDTSTWPVPADGSAPTANQRGAGFVWADREPFTYQNWAGGQPNNSPNQDYVRMTQATGEWDDRDSTISSRYVIEYDVNQSVGQQPMPSRFSIVEAHSPTALNSIDEAINFLSTGSGTVYTYAEPVINLIDLPGTDSHFPNSFSFKGDTPGANESNYALRITATVRLPWAGTYTFGVNSDDGFRLQIEGADFTSSTGSGTVVAGDTMTFSGTRAPGDSLGVAALSAGDHRVELTYFQGGGGAGLEFFAAPGSKTAFDNTFKLVGDTSGGGLLLATIKSSVATDIQSAMYNKNASAYIRIPFTVKQAGMTRLTLRMKYDDGFVAYINGHEVARSDSAPSVLAWNSAATEAGLDSDALSFEDFDASSALPYLHVGGPNVLAIQALNAASDDPDLLIVPELVGAMEPTAFDQSRYFQAPTPGKANGSGSVDLGPVLTNLMQTPKLPGDNDNVVVTAVADQALSPVATVALYYKVTAGSTTSGETMVTMYDDGAHGDGAAGDHVYGAVIPASAASAGQLVRYYVLASDTTSRTTRWPLIPVTDPDPTSTRKWPEYQGYMIPDPTVQSTMPVLYWFVDNLGAVEWRSGTRGAVWFNGELYDNVFLRSRGGSSTGGTKIDFNKGYYFKLADGLDRVAEINLNKKGSNTWSSAIDDTWIRPVLTFEMFRDAGSLSPMSYPMRVQMNGTYGDLRIFIEEPDDEYLKRQGFYGDGALYKTPNSDNGGISSATYFEKKNRETEGYSDLQAFLDGIHQTNIAARTKFLFDNVDIPRVLDYLAVQTLVEEMDCVQKNYFLYRDTRDADNPNGSNMWMILPWDQHLTFGKNYGFADYTGTDPQAHPFFGDSEHPKIDGAGAWNYLIDVVLDTPLIKEMYLRRLRSVMDQMLQPASTPYADRYLETRLDELYAQLMGDARVKLQISDIKSAFDDLKNRYLGPKRVHMYEDHSANEDYPDYAGIPGAQPVNPNIAFGGFEYNPASGNQDQEYVQLVNPNNYAVDVSGWRLDGAIHFTMPGGTVIPALGSVYVAKDVGSFLSRTSGPGGNQGLFVVGPYKDALSAWGETVTLKDGSDRVVGTLNYAGNPTAMQRGLRVTELMYNPKPAGTPGAADNDEFEYVELTNISAQPLNLNGVKFTQGIDFVFGDVTLAPGGYVLVVKNRAAFESRYGTGLPIAGEYVNKYLDNSGDRIRLEDASGEQILDFEYNNNWYWSTDHRGRSLVIKDSTAAPSTWSDAASWRPSAADGGSPGVVDPAPDATAPVASIQAVSPDPHTTPVDTITITFSEPVGRFGLKDLSLSRDGGANLLAANQTLTTTDNITWTLGNLGGITGFAGSYVLKLTVAGSNIIDAEGTPLAADASMAFTSASTWPAASFTYIAPEVRNAGIGSIDILFTKAVSEFYVSDLRLSRDGGPDLLAGSGATLEEGADNAWTLSGLDVLTSASGSYVLTLVAAGSNIHDSDGNPLAGDAVTSFTVDAVPPTAKIVPVAPSLRHTGVDSATVMFSEPVIAFPLSGFQLMRNGTPIALTDAQTPVTQDNITWTVPNLAWLTGGEGDYTMTVLGAGSGILDAAHNEPVATAAADFTVDATAPTASMAAIADRTSGLGALTITFSEAVVGLDPEDLRLTRDGGANLLGAGQVLSNTEGITWTINGLSSITALPGTYVFSLGTDGTAVSDRAGNMLAAAVSRSWRNTTTAPYLTAVTLQGPARTNAAMPSIEFTFSEPVTGFTLDDLRLTRSNSGNVLGGATLELKPGSTTVWVLSNLSGSTSTLGTYVLTLSAANSGIIDASGNALVGDARISWVCDKAAPSVDIVDVAPDAHSGAVDSIAIVFNERATGLDVADLTLTREGSGNLLTGAQTVTRVDNVTWILGNLRGLTGTAGTYTLSLATDAITDSAGNPVTAGASDTFTVVDNTPPTATITAVSPDPRGVPLPTMEIVFSEPVDGLSIHDLVLSRDGGPNLLTDAQTVTPDADHIKWAVGDLTGLTWAAGKYVLSLNPAGSKIVDKAQNAMVQPASQSFTMYVIAGDQGGTVQDDVIRLTRDANDPNLAHVSVTGREEYTLSLANMSRLRITSQGGDDRIIVDFSNGSPLPLGQLSIDGGAGVNVLELDGASPDDAFSIMTGAVQRGSASFSFSRISTLALASGNYAVVADAGREIDVLGGGMVTFQASQNLPTLNIAAGGTAILAAGGDKVLSTAGLDIAAGGTLDLSDNDMILMHSEGDHGAAKVEQLRNWLRSALVGGGEASPWNGTGLTSTAARDNGNMDTAIAIFNNDDGEGNPWMESFNGIPVDQSAIILKYTYFGDSNADGQITADDFAAATAGWFDQMGGIAPTWMSGDYDYDGKVTADDFALVTGSWFSQDRSKPLSSGGVAPVSAEPAPEAGVVPAESVQDSALPLPDAVALPAIAKKPEPNVLLVDDLAVLA